MIVSHCSRFQMASVSAEMQPVWNFAETHSYNYYSAMMCPVMQPIKLRRTNEVNNKNNNNFY